MKMSYSISRADLIRCIGNGLGDGKRWAHLFGYSAIEEAAEQPIKNVTIEIPKIDLNLQLSEITGHIEAQHPEQQKASFVYVQSYEPVKKEARQEKQIIPLSIDDISCKSLIPDPPQLLPRARLNSIVSTAVSYCRRSGEPDYRKVVKKITNLEPLFPVAWKTRTCGAQRIIILADRRYHQRAFLVDQNRVINHIKKQYGKEVVRVLFIDDCMPLNRCIKKVTSFSSFNSAVLLLSDCGCLELRVAEMKFWIRSGMLLREKGLKITALAPCPQNRIPSMLQSVWNIQIWDRGARHSGKSNVSLTGAPNFRTLTEKKVEDAEKAKKLLSLLSPCVYVEGALVRKLRYKLGSRFFDIGIEADVWNHPGVRSDPLGFTVRSDLKEQLKSGFDRYRGELVFSIIEFIREQQDRLPPLVMAEQMLNLSTISKNSDVFCLRYRQLYEKLLEYLKQHGDPLKCKHPLAGWFNRYKKECAPDELWKDPLFSALWMATEKYLPDDCKQKLPAHFNSESMQFLTDPDGIDITYILYQHGMNVSVYPHPDNAGNRTFKNGYYHQICEFTAGSEGVIVETRESETYKKQHHYETTLFDMLIPAGGLISIESEYEKLVFDEMIKPSWADEIQRCKEGFVASYQKDGIQKKCVWLNPGKYVVYDSGGDSVLLTKHTIKQGFWWDSEEYEQFRRDGLSFTKPSWARMLGIDEYGLWAEFTYKNITQRMRWIPPGRFMMGSPEDEPERSDYETLHEVTLTQGFWLADTACTQELWQAVMGTNPSNFKYSPQNPVEQVSWDMICETGGFLDRINRAISGLNLQLPTEAQWEYACRVGTTTPFWWGSELTTEKANYNGTYPYNDQKKGEYREKTVPVKSFERNPWGLWQMHGNVWEWCEDWYGAFPVSPVADPYGSVSGMDRVLRGGSWRNDGRDLRSARRGYNHLSFGRDSYGFRLSRDHSEQKEQDQADKKENGAERSDQVSLAKLLGEEEGIWAVPSGRTIAWRAPKKRRKK